MSGTHEGAMKIKAKLLEQDPEHYAKIGSKGGTAPHTEPPGFGSDKVGLDGLTGKERAQKMGKTVGFKAKEQI